MNNQVVENSRIRIIDVLIFYVRMCFIAHRKNKMYDRDEILKLIDMCVEALFDLGTNVERIENIITSLGLKYFKRNFFEIENYINRILPGYNMYEKIEIDSDSTNLTE